MILPTIETARLVLRPWRMDDAAALAANLTPSVTRWLASWPDPMTEAIAAERLARVLADVEAGKEVSWAITHEGRLIGGIGFHVGGFPIPGKTSDDRAEVGYHIAEGLHGKGLMSEAAAAALTTAWELLPAVMWIEGGVLPGNPGSEAVLTRLGMARANNRIIYSPARKVDELCHCYEMSRPARH